MSSSDEPLTTSPLEGENGAFEEEDPLTDPLAIDDDEYVSSSSANPIEHIEEIIADAETNSIDNFIFVDIEKLKNKISKNSSAIKHTQSDINGNNSEHSVKCDDELVKNSTKIVIDKNQSNTLDPSDDNNIASETIVKNNDEEENLIVNSKSVDNNSSSFVISVTSSEPSETDEVTDTSVLLEEIRSDGSDSGLGLDTLRNISVIEKNLATLTPSKSSLKRRSCDTLHEDQPKKARQGLNFGDVTVFYFPRCQGFSCVPTQGGSTLGMTSKHAYKKTFTLSEHAIEQRRLNRLKMAGSELNPSSSSSDESKSDDEISEHSLSEADSEAYGFLQPVTARQRRAILKAAGVRKIDTSEKDECRQLRTSREVCGCTCNGYCDPDTCECSLAGIKCQVDRLKPHEFPCGCTRDGCANVNGRIEFNPARVKTHFIHTIMRLELEKRQELSEDMPTSVIQHSATKWWSQMRSSSSSPSPSNGNYSSYYAQQQQQYAKIPPISTIPPASSSSVISQESLDLHYAYRDDYTNTLSLGGESSAAAATASAVVSNNSAFQSSNDYYSNYNYHAGSSSSSSSSSSGIYYHHYHHLNYTTDCQYSNYTPTNGSASGSSSVYRTEPITDYYTPPATSSSLSASHIHNSIGRINYHHSSVIAATPEISSPSPPPPPQQSTSSLSQLANNDNNSYCTIAQHNNNNNNIETSNSNNDSNENLSEIIKKSIVESVTA